MPSAPFSPQFFRKLQQLKIRARRSFLGTRQGSHISPRRGQGLEFADYRPYAPGDDFRHIDWGVYARIDRFYVREFRAEQDLFVGVLLDGSASMGTPSERSKYEVAAEIGIALGYISLSDGDSVQYSVLGNGGKKFPRISGARSIYRAASELQHHVPNGECNFLAEVRAAISAMKVPGRCFLVSDFFYPLDQILDTLQLVQARNFELSVLHVLSPAEIEVGEESSGILRDVETGEELELVLDETTHEEYSRLLREHQHAISTYCRAKGMAYLLVRTDENVEDVVLSRFTVAGIVK